MTTEEEVEILKELEKTLGETNLYIGGEVNPKYLQIIDEILKNIPIRKRKIKKKWQKHKIKILKKQSEIRNGWNSTNDQFLNCMKFDENLARLIKSKAKQVNENNLELITENFTKKIIFLDIDGVLNQGTGGPQRLLLDRFKPIVDNKCNIVISSSWRCEIEHIEWLLWSFYHEIGHCNMFIGVTENRLLDKFRAQEIFAWLENCNLEITHFIALDDLKLTKLEGSEFLKNCFVQTNASKGITLENIQQINELLELSSSN